MTPPVAFEAEGAHVGEVTFAAALGDRDNVISIPERFAALQAPSGGGFETGDAAETTEVGVFGDAVDAAERANSFIALEDALTQMAGIAAEPPFFHTEGGAERLPPSRHFKLAPTTETAAMGAFGKGGFSGAAGAR